MRFQELCEKMSYNRLYAGGKGLEITVRPLKLEFWSMTSKTFDKNQKNNVTSSLGASLKKVN